MDITGLHLPLASPESREFEKAKKSPLLFTRSSHAIYLAFHAPIQ
jgi:hypothetical protein